MTESEWLACTDPTPMLEFLRGKASERKLRLFAVALLPPHYGLCCPTKGATDVLRGVAERLADGLATECGGGSCENLPPKRPGINDQQAGGAAGSAGWGAVCCTVAVSAGHAAGRSSESSAAASGFASTILRYTPTWGDNTAYFAAVSEGTAKERLAQPPLLREIFGTIPFRPVTANPLWLTPVVVGFAQAIYDDRAFDRLPILADALEEAGCDNADILDHCRGSGPHVRGCWVVDLLLGKE